MHHHRNRRHFKEWFYSSSGVKLSVQNSDVSPLSYFARIIEIQMFSMLFQAIARSDCHDERLSPCAPALENSMMHSPSESAPRKPRTQADASHSRFSGDKGVAFISIGDISHLGLCLGQCLLLACHHRNRCSLGNYQLCELQPNPLRASSYENVPACKLQLCRRPEPRDQKEEEEGCGAQGQPQWDRRKKREVGLIHSSTWSCCDWW